MTVGTNGQLPKYCTWRSLVVLHVLCTVLFLSRRHWFLFPPEPKETDKAALAAHGFSPRHPSSQPCEIRALFFPLLI